MTDENCLSSRARSPGETARHVSNAAFARAMAASVSSMVSEGTVVTTDAVIGLMTS
jgi:hypothetical protein